MLSRNFEQIKPFLDNLVGKTGSINITIDNFSIKLDNKSVVGDALESWIIDYLNTCLASNKIALTVEENTISQTFPDAYLIPTYGEKTYLEIKTFNYDSAPNFDIANFESYVESLVKDPKKIDADYLVIGYTLRNSVLKIEKIWYKKIWELCCKSENWDLRLQIKRDMIYNIRPYNLKGELSNLTYKPFGTKQEFLDSIQRVLNQYEKTKNNFTDWLDKIK